MRTTEIIISRKSATSVAVSLALMFSASLFAEDSTPAGMALVPAGTYEPVVRARTDAATVPVKAFYLDIAQVSNSDYLKFVQANPRWQRSNVKRLFADESYLKDWAGDLELGSNAPAGAPVVYVSWFAAKAYAQWHGKRLPSTAEWELAASASATRPDGQHDNQFKTEVLRWYTEPGEKNFPSANNGTPNYYGIRNLHGLVWEWVGDFNSALVSGDSRDGGIDGRLFCGAGAQNTQNVDDYPAFMRYAFRSSLHADYCVHNLGFRCAKDL